MSLTKAQKIEELNALKDLVARSSSMVVADYKGLTVAKLTDLRKQCRQADVSLRVSKNTLLIRALQGSGMEAMDKILSGPTAVAFALGEPTAPARILSAYAKENEQLKIKGGAMEGQVLAMDRIRYMATLGTRQQVLAKVLGGIQAPATGIAMNLLGVHRKLLGLMTAYQQKLHAAA